MNLGKYLVDLLEVKSCHSLKTFILHGTAAMEAVISGEEKVP